MEVSVIGSSQAKIGADLAYRDEALFCNLSRQVLNRKSQIGFGQSIRGSERSAVRLYVKAAAQPEPAVSDKKTSTCRNRSARKNGVRVYVGLPADAVSRSGTINHAGAIAVGLRALKLLGVDGVELPVWWGIAEGEAKGKYEWSGYLALAEMVQKAGLKLQISLCFHALREPKIPLPEWVSQIGESQPTIFFTDRAGQQYRDCLSFSVDDLPVLDGKTPIQVYKEFCESFKLSFSPYLHSTITGISIGLGPNGELRYPSHHHSRTNNTRGVGEFQCYDKNMLNLLKQHAQAAGNPLWGLSGPHDAPSYDQSPNSNTFFKEHGGSWETQYGDFFLSWYSSQLLLHGDRLLSLAASVFGDNPVKISGKVPLVTPWSRTRSHAAELTAGFYNTANRDGYEAVVETFAKNSCKMILPGMDLSDKHQPHEAPSSPESLLSQIATTCRKKGVEVAGENLSVSGAPNGYEQIKKNLLDESGVVKFTYQRMGAYFFSPEHFPSFTSFIRSLNQAEMNLDDMAGSDEVEAADLHMQAA